MTDSALHSAGAALAGRRLLGAGSDEDSDADDAVDDGQRLSKHERRTRAMQERIAAMEAAAMSEKDWFMRGETQAGAHLSSFDSAAV